MADAPRRPAAWLAARQPLVRFLVEGAITVHTPPTGTPALTTIVQLDGDLVSYVSATLLRDHPEAARRVVLLRDHQRAVAAAMPRLPRLDRATWMLVGGAAGAIESVALVSDLIAGAGLVSLSVHAAGLAPLGFRGAARRVMLRLLRYSAGSLTRRERAAICRKVKAHGIAALRRDGAV